jgi:hypothetical protein
LCGSVTHLLQLHVKSLRFKKIDFIFLSIVSSFVSIGSHSSSLPRIRWHWKCIRKVSWSQVTTEYLSLEEETMKIRIAVTAVGLLLIAASQFSYAQVIWPQPGTVVVPPVQGPVVLPGQPIIPNTFPPGTIVQPGGPMIPGQIVMPGQIIYPQPWPGVTIPQQPAVITPNTVTSWNPQTGGWNTANTQLDNTVWAPSRNIQANQRWERRPVYDTFGRLTGYQEGWVWNNVFTGQEHGNLNTYTPNQMGGVHQGTIHYSQKDPNEPDQPEQPNQ